MRLSCVDQRELFVNSEKSVCVSCLLCREIKAVLLSHVQMSSSVMSKAQSVVSLYFTWEKIEIVLNCLSSTQLNKLDNANAVQNRVASAEISNWLLSEIKSECETDYNK